MILTPRQHWQPPLSHPLAAAPGLIGEMHCALSSYSLAEPLVAAQLIAHVSLLAQGTANVAWPNGLDSPVGQSVLLLAPSGAGKSLVTRLLAKPIHHHLSGCARFLQTGQKLPEFFIEDSTREAAIQHLLEWPVAGLFTDEAGQLKRLLSTGAPTLAKLIDGSRLRHARISTGRADLHDYRFMMLLMEQPAVFLDSKLLLGATQGGVGLLNRFHIASADAMPSGTSAFELHLPKNVSSRYEERVRVLLDSTIDLVQSGRSRTSLMLSHGAQRRLIEVGAQLRAASQNCLSYAAAGEYVSRHAERVLRLAGALHVFHHDPVGEVELESLEVAHQIDLCSIESFVALTETRPKPTQADLDAADIERALQELAWRGTTLSLLSDLRRMSPNIGLTKARFDRALPVLAGSGKVTLFVDRNRDWLNFNRPQRQFLLTH